jgi:hypothetical protein
MVQLHLEDDYVVVVKAEVVDLIIVTTKVQARAQDPVIPKRPSSWIYSIFKEFKIRVESRKTIRKYSLEKMTIEYRSSLVTPSSLYLAPHAKNNKASS